MQGGREMKSIVLLLALVFVTAAFADPSNMLVPIKDRIEHDIDDEEVKEIIEEYCNEFPDYAECMVYFGYGDEDKSLPKFLAE
jgi:hypothetical protein